MSVSLDNLTAGVGTLETVATATTAQIAQLQAAGENAPALDALTARVKVVSDVLTAAIAPKA